MISPAATSIVTASTTVLSPKRLVRFLTEIAGAVTVLPLAG